MRAKLGVEEDQEEAAVREEKRERLEPGGTLLVLQPNFRLAPRRYFDFIDHQVILTDRSLVEALSVAGFDLSRAPCTLPAPHKQVCAPQVALCGPSLSTAAPPPVAARGPELRRGGPTPDRRLNATVVDGGLGGNAARVLDGSGGLRVDSDAERDLV